jgi:hypothetical protein
LARGRDGGIESEATTGKDGQHLGKYDWLRPRRWHIRVDQRLLGWHRARCNSRTKAMMTG